MSRSEINERYSALTDEIKALDVKLANSAEYKQFANVKRDIEILCEQIATEEIVAAKNQQLLEILDGAPVAVAITSDGVIRYANRRVSELLGVKVGDRAPDWYVNPADRDRLLETLQRDGAVRRAEIQLYGPNREIRDVLATLAVTQYEGRESILAWLVDLTERRKVEEALRENRRLLETILEHSPAVIYSKRKDGRYVYINREWENATSIVRETVLGRTDFEVFPEDIAQQFRTNDLTAMAAGRMTESEERLDTPSGEQVFLSRKVPLASGGGEVEGICGISTNITDRRRAELALKEANTMLQQRTNELAKSLEDLRTAQNRLIQTEKLASLGQLTAGIAHEIKNPLNFVIHQASGGRHRPRPFHQL
jgi:PAS domain S-box-containing protein